VLVELDEIRQALFTLAPICRDHQRKELLEVREEEVYVKRLHVLLSDVLRAALPAGDELSAVHKLHHEA
jgi:hypothetical protein